MLGSGNLNQEIDRVIHHLNRVKEHKNRADALATVDDATSLMENEVLECFTARDRLYLDRGWH